MQWSYFLFFGPLYSTWKIINKDWSAWQLKQTQHSTSLHDLIALIDRANCWSCFFWTTQVANFALTTIKESNTRWLLACVRWVVFDALTILLLKLAMNFFLILMSGFSVNPKNPCKNIVPSFYTNSQHYLVCMFSNSSLVLFLVPTAVSPLLGLVGIRSCHYHVQAFWISSLCSLWVPVVWVRCLVNIVIIILLRIRRHTGS